MPLLILALVCSPVGGRVLATPQSDQHSAERLGSHVESLRAAMRVIPSVVIVPDERSYLEALSTWTVQAGEGNGAAPRLTAFPILIDDGDPICREHVAAFTRAFSPEQVVRWQAHAGSQEKGALLTPMDVISVVPGVWGTPRRGDGGDGAAGGSAELSKQLRERHAELKWTPPGLVMITGRDHAWTGAVALAAARGQALALASGTTPHGGALELSAARALNDAARDAARAAGCAVPCAITIGCDLPVKVATGDDRKVLALTDVVGRDFDETGARSSPVRWAWCGQLSANGPFSAYQAMCAIFLDAPRDMLMISGYDSSAPWNDYSGAAAAAAWRAAGSDRMCELLDGHGSGATVADLRARKAWTTAGLVCVNSSGNSDFFNLGQKSRAAAGDLPLLGRPAAVYMVHSFSAEDPSDRETICGRFLERGAYAYLGSVDEPLLTAFVPTPTFVERIAANWPFAAACRLDQGDAWKLTVLADPLLTLAGAPLSRDAAAHLPLARFKVLWPRQAEEDIAAAGTKPIDEWNLALAGQDLEVLRHWLSRPAEGAPPPQLARACVAPVSRAVAESASPEHVEAMRSLVDLATREGVDRRAEGGPIKDLAWALLRESALAAGDGRRRAVDVLRRCVRSDQAGADAAELMVWIRELDGGSASDQFVESVRSSLRTDKARSRFDRDLKRR